MERQRGQLSSIRPDHINRYRFAATHLSPKSRALDAACGCGYGTKILWDVCEDVDGLDIEQEAIDYAVANYSGPRYICKPIETAEIRPWYDLVVSFETLEHLTDPLHALRKFRAVSDKLIASVPNEDQYKFNPENFAKDKYPHRRHYRPQEFESLLDAGGFKVKQRNMQRDKRSQVQEGTDGMFLIYVCGSR